ncbi:MAG: barstar family protein [Pseudomonadota bacterium]
MGKLLQRLSDASRSGVYRAPRADAILESVRGSPISAVRISLSGVSEKQALLEQIARTLEFPGWFGGNWDALEDCLTDLSWLQGAGHVLLIEDAAQLARDDRGVLADILASAAAYWAERGKPFFAVFIGEAPGLAELYREKQ